MKKIVHQLIAIMFILTMTPAIFASEGEESTTPVSFSKSAQHFLYSKEINQKFRIDVAMPMELIGGLVKNYPVIYVMDGGLYFPIVFSNMRALATGVELPPAITVGIAYDNSNAFETAALRMRDLTPTSARSSTNQTQSGEVSSPSEVASGGAEKFFQFIEGSVKPFINAKYPTDPDNETFVGYSLGGLFGLHLLFNHTESFDKYVLVSPSIQWENNIALNYESRYAENHNDLPKSVFLSTGSLEGEEMIANTQTMYERLTSREYPHLKVDYFVFEGETHVSVGGVAINRGLKSVLAEETRAYSLKIAKAVGGSQSVKDPEKSNE